MTSEQAMLSVRARANLARLLIVLTAGAAGCSGEKSLDDPRMFPSPYPGPKLWAVVPFRNETGSSVVDGARFADHLVASLQQVEGIDVLPTNRVIEAMRARRVNEIRSVEEAMALVSALNVDGVLVGAVTAWDPYDPPKIGAKVQLYARQTDKLGGGIDSRQVTRAATDPRVVVTRGDQPVAQAGSFFDASNHGVLKNLRAYAVGRVPQESPAGWRRYVLDMDLYSQFVSHELMRLLFKAEWERLTVPARAGGQQAEQTTKP